MWYKVIRFDVGGFTVDDTSWEAEEIKPNNHVECHLRQDQLTLPVSRAFRRTRIILTEKMPFKSVFPRRQS